MYITNDHLTISETSKLAKEVTPIPKLFEGYVGHNEIKRKKVKKRKKPWHYTQTYYIRMPRSYIHYC